MCGLHNCYPSDNHGLFVDKCENASICSQTGTMHESTRARMAQVYVSQGELLQLEHCVSKRLYLPHSFLYSCKHFQVKDETHLNMYKFTENKLNVPMCFSFTKYSTFSHKLFCFQISFSQAYSCLTAVCSLDFHFHLDLVLLCIREKTGQLNNMIQTNHINIVLSFKSFSL